MVQRISIPCVRCGRERSIVSVDEDGDLCGGCVYIAEHPEFPINVIRGEYDDAVEKAWSNLARYKFSNFGYWASRVVFLGQVSKQMGGPHLPNPFKPLVHAARVEQKRIADAEAAFDEHDGFADQALRDARIAAGAEFVDDSEERAIDAAADHNAPRWYPGDDEDGDPGNGGRRG